MNNRMVPLVQAVLLPEKNQIMVQAATAILAQSNTLPQLALQLLG